MLFFPRRQQFLLSAKSIFVILASSCVEDGTFSCGLRVLAPWAVGLCGDGRREGRSETLDAVWPSASSRPVTLWGALRVMEQVIRAPREWRAHVPGYRGDERSSSAGWMNGWMKGWPCACSAFPQHMFPKCWLGPRHCPGTGFRGAQP